MAKIGKLTISLLISAEEEEEKELTSKITKLGYRYCTGRTGTMDSKAIIAAIETTARREEIVLKDSYREEHALYHSALGALKGLCRGEVGIGSLLRTVGVKFAVLRGPMDTTKKELGEWISVGIYGTIGSPIKGFEHEAIGLDMDSI